MAATPRNLYDAADRTSEVDLTIGAGAAVSDVADLRGLVVLAIRVPTGWTAAALAASECASEAGTYQPVYDDGGGAAGTPNEWRLPVVSTGGQSYLVASLDPWRFLKLRSVNASTGAGVNQVSQVIVTLVCKVSP